MLAILGPNGCGKSLSLHTFAGLRPAHPVGNHEQGRTLEEGVLVGPALTAGVRMGELFGDAEHQPSS